MNNDEKPLEVRLNKKQIEVYRTFIEAAELIKDTIIAFDGKVLNVKLENALKNIGLEEQLGVYICVRKQKYGTNKEIIITANDDYIKSSPNKECSITEYVQNREYYVKIATNNKRINAKDTFKNIKDENDYIMNQIKELSIANTLYHDMLTDYKKLTTLIDDYRNKYDYSIRGQYDRF